MSGLLSNAISGLQASQNALRTAGHNISNANTQGYSRQDVNYVARPEQSAGPAGYIGSGVNTVSIERIVNDFVTKQLRLDTSTHSQLNTYNTYISKVDSLLADASTGLSSNIESFFASIQSANTDPSSISSRQLVINQANNLSSKLHSLYARIQEVDQGAKADIQSVAGQISSLAKNIASLNQSIGRATASADGNPPNDLFDQRDEALRQLSELVSIQTMTQSNGDINVSIAGGHSLVLGTSAGSLSLAQDGNLQISFANNKTTIPGDLAGGKLGGLVSFRSEVIGNSLNQLGMVAVAVADEFNKLQSQGIDLDGEYGSPMFNDINSTTSMTNRVSHGINASPQDRVLSVSIDDVSKLTGSDYTLKLVPNTLNYVITRASDDTIVKQGMLSGSYPVSMSFDGLTVNLTSGSFQGGDSFTIQPTRHAAVEIQTVMNRPEDLALASPLRTSASPSNSGDGLVSQGSVLGTKDANGNILPTFAETGKLSPPMIIRFTSATTYEVLDNSDPANPKPLTPPMAEKTFVPGVNNSIFSEDAGETSISGNGRRIGLPAGRAPESGLTAGSTLSNQYLAEQLRFTTTDSAGNVSTSTFTTTSGASAATTAQQLNMLSGVTANAYTTATINNINLAPADAAPPTQIVLNGINLLGLDPSGLQFAEDVPDFSNTGELNDYLATQINGNATFKSLGVRATSTTNELTGASELSLVSSTGQNIDIRLVGSAASSIDVNDSMGNPNVRLNGSNTGAGEQTGIVVGGRIDLTLASGKSVVTAPTDSPLFGNSAAADFAQSSYHGLQVVISGSPKAGDIFTIGFNTDAINDNRNGLSMSNTQTQGLTQGGLTLGQSYGKLVEDVGTKSNLSKINTEASKSLLIQTQSTRDSISGVNLDEEASNLIRFQQAYQANAQVISVARELFDTLLNSL